MKKIIFLVLLLLCVGNVSATNYDAGLVTTADYLRFLVDAVDDTGAVARPDSGHLIVFFEGEATANSASYTARWATGGATDAVVDSFVLGSKIYWYFVDAIADIDNGEGEGNYHGTVIMFTDGQGFKNSFSFMLYDTELELLFDSIGTVQDVATGAIDATAIADDAIDFGTFAGTAPTAWWNINKTGYSLTQTFPTNFEDMAITNTTGLVDINGKTGFSLSGTQTFNNTGTWTGNLTGSVASVTGLTTSLIADAVWDEDSTGHYTSPNMAYLASQVGGTGSAPTEAEIYTYFTSVSREDLFKATGFSTLTALENWSYVTRTLTTADWTTDADLTPLALEASLFDGDLSTLATLANQALLIDSLYALLDSTQKYIDVTISSRSTFDPTTDTVVVSDTTVQGDTLAVKKDSLIFQGGTSSLTPASIYSYFATQQPGTWSAVGGAGSGANVVTIFAIDTSGVDDTIPYVNFAVYSTAGSLLGTGQTGVTGSFNANLDDGNTQFVATLGAAYTFPDSTATVTGVSAVDTIYIYGYNNVIPDPGTPSLATVYAYLYNIYGLADSGIVVTTKRIGGKNATNTTSGFMISPQVQIDTTDATGYFSFDLLRSDEYDSATKGLYKIIGKKRGLTVFSIDSLAVPPTGNLDITDSVAVR